MDAEDTQKQQKQKKIVALQRVVARGLKGINECRYKDQCQFARQCPATC